MYVKLFHKFKYSSSSEAYISYVKALPDSMTIARKKFDGIGLPVPSTASTPTTPANIATVVRISNYYLYVVCV